MTQYFGSRVPISAKTGVFYGIDALNFPFFNIALEIYSRVGDLDQGQNHRIVQSIVVDFLK